MPDDDQPQPGAVQITGVTEVAPDLLVVPKPGLAIHSMYNGYWFWGWPSFAGLYRDLREVIQEVPGLGPGHARPAGELGDRRRRAASSVSGA